MAAAGVRLALREVGVDQVVLDDLLRRACRHEPEALTALVDIFSPRVFGLLYRLTGKRDVAEDLMQETFLRMVRVIGEYEPTGRFDAWLLRIAANLARDRARRRARRREGGPQAGGGNEPLDRAAPPSHDPAARVTQAEAGAQLAAGLARLPEADREILLLRHQAELPFQEIADLLGIPLGTALARAHRALRKLRSELGEA